MDREDEMVKQMKVKINRIPYSSWHIMARSKRSTGIPAGFCGKLEYSVAPQDPKEVVFLLRPANTHSHYFLYTSTLMFRKPQSQETRSDENCLFYCIMASTKDNYTRGDATSFKWMHKFIRD